MAGMFNFSEMSGTRAVLTFATFMALAIAAVAIPGHYAMLAMRDGPGDH